MKLKSRLSVVLIASTVVAVVVVAGLLYPAKCKITERGLFYQAHGDCLQYGIWLYSEATDSGNQAGGSYEFDLQARMEDASIRDWFSSLSIRYDEFRVQTGTISFVSCDAPVVAVTRSFSFDGIVTGHVAVTSSLKVRVLLAEEYEALDQGKFVDLGAVGNSLGSQ